MLHTVPIYCCNIEVAKCKASNDPKKVVKQIITLTNVVVKGFLPEDILKNNKNHIEKIFAKNSKLSESEYMKIIRIRFMIQLGYGVPNN